MNKSEDKYMTVDEYLDKHQAIQFQISKLNVEQEQLEVEYFSQFPGIGDNVSYRGETYRIHWVHKKRLLPEYIIKKSRDEEGIIVDYSDLDK